MNDVTAGYDFLKVEQDRQKREREYCSEVTRNCLHAIEYLADAGRAPRASMNSIKEARQALAAAAHYSELLQDMEEK